MMDFILEHWVFFAVVIVLSAHGLYKYLHECKDFWSQLLNQYPHVEEKADIEGGLMGKASGALVWGDFAVSIDVAVVEVGILVFKNPRERVLFAWDDISYIYPTDQSHPEVLNLKVARDPYGSFDIQIPWSAGLQMQLERYAGPLSLVPNSGTKASVYDEK